MSATAWVAVPLSISRGSQGVVLAPPTSVGDRIRATVNRLSRQVDPEVRDALGQIGDALTDLEHRMSRMQHRMELAELGMELKNELVRVAESGIGLQHAIPFAAGEEVVVYLDLNVRGSSRLLSLPGRVRKPGPEARVDFVGLTQDLRDTLVAYVFQEQGRVIRKTQAARG